MFQGTKAIKFLFYTNVLTFGISALLMMMGINVIGLFALWNYHLEYFMPHQLITYQFLHGGIMHLLFNMLAMISLLPSVEDYLGTKKFVIYYLLCGIFAGLFNSFMTASNIPMVGASGSLWGMVVVFALLFPNTKLNFMFVPYGIKAKWMIGVLAAIELILGLSNVSDGIGHFCHVGGMIMGLILFTLHKYESKMTN